LFIIGIVAAIAIPSLINMHQNAATPACMIMPGLFDNFFVS
jgi:hypothetical protein